MFVCGSDSVYTFLNAGTNGNDVGYRNSGPHFGSMNPSYKGKTIEHFRNTGGALFLFSISGFSSDPGSNTIRYIRVRDYVNNVSTKYDMNPSRYIYSSGTITYDLDPINIIPTDGVTQAGFYSVEINGKPL